MHRRIIKYTHMVHTAEEVGHDLLGHDFHKMQSLLIYDNNICQDVLSDSMCQLSYVV